MNTIIELNNVSKAYQMGASTVNALRGVTLTLEKGAYYSIMGPSGSGKSSLLHIMGCMDSPNSGTAWFNGRDITSLPERELTKIRAQEIGFVFQAFYLNPILTARENVAMALRLVGTRKRPALEKADHWLARMGLADRIHHYPAELSGGERQRVALARAIAKTPSLILADEPTGNLDSQRGREIIGLMRQICREEKATIIQVTHDREADEASDAIFILRDGQICGRRDLN